MSTTATRSSSTFSIGKQVLRLAERRAAFLLMALALALVVAYIYFLATAVVFAVEHKEVRHAMASAHSRIATMEVEYLHKKASITRNSATSMGLAHITTKDFVERTRYIGRASN